MTRPDTQSVESLEAVISKLEKHRADLEQRGKELATIRASLAYSALADNDDKSRVKLDKLNLEAGAHSSEVAAVQAAIKTATERFAVARRREAMQVNDQHARVIREQWAQADFAAVDERGKAWVAAIENIYRAFEVMQQHGLKPPPQLSLMMADVVTSLLMSLPPPLWRGLNHLGLDHLPPNRRRNAASLKGAWDLQVKNQAAAIGGEPAPTEAA